MVHVSPKGHHYWQRPVADIIRVLFNVLYCHKVNKDKKAGKYDQYIASGDDRDPSFKLIL